MPGLRASAARSRESDVEIVCWKFVAAKTHCHLFLMSSPPLPKPRPSSAFSVLTLREENRRGGGVDSPPNGERRSGFISVHGSRAAGNSFLSPRGRSARFGPVSAQCVLKETRCSLRGVRVPLVVFIHICIRLLFGSINTSIVHNDQFEDIRLAHAACASWQGVVALEVEVVESSSSSRN